MNRRRALAGLLACGLALGGPSGSAGGASIQASDLKEWLTYISSDELEGRATFSAGLGLAAGYIRSHLASWAVEPAGDHRSYLQTVRVLGIKSVNRSSVTVRVGRETRTFKNGEGVLFPPNVGGKRTLTLSRVEFVGYGLDAPDAGHTDLAGRDLSGSAVIFLGANGPRGLDGARYRRLLAGRSRHATEQARVAASVGPAAVPVPSGNGQRSGDRGGATAVDFTTTQRLDQPIAPSITAGDPFFEFLFSRAPSRYDELRRKAAGQEPLPAFPLTDVSLTITLDADYEVVRTQLTHNVVAIVPGSDPELRNSYVAFGAHYDHVGYAEAEVAAGRSGLPGRVTPGTAQDRVWNGADDDGSGTVALLALAKAFATGGAAPKRSILFVWHAGEERGLWGSRYFADYPTVPLDRIVAQLNIDMIGRNRDDLASEADTVYLVGSDRISTELHEINRAANASLPRPMRLDYELNDPADLEQFYYRSDHYSYAAKGVPIIFFTTGLHPDYHANTDEVSKIEFDKMTRITQLVYETGLRVANLDHAPRRDNLGPRAGKGTRE
jgi:hypothetical protein